MEHRLTRASLLPKKPIESGGHVRGRLNKDIRAECSGRIHRLKKKLKTETLKS
jgi:hypothetical protein